MGVIELEKSVLLACFVFGVVCIVSAFFLSWLQYRANRKLKKQLLEKRMRRVINQRRIEEVIRRAKLCGDLNTQRMAKQIVMEVD